MGLLLWLARALWWLADTSTLSSAGWTIGWPACRLLTLGRFPGAGFAGRRSASILDCVVVELVGLVILGTAIWWFCAR